MKLYEISQEFNELQNMELPADVITDTLQGIEMELKDKAQNISHLVQSWNDDIESLNKEVKRLNDMKRVRANKIKALKDYLSHNMERMEIDKIECPLFSITLKKSGVESVVIDDESEIDSNYIVTKTAPNKTAIKQAIKAGEVVKGAHLEACKRGLVIK